MAYKKLMSAVIPVIIFLFLAVNMIAQNKVALVIGNSVYSGNGESLKNPVNDADLMASTLQNVGFSVIKRTNCNKQNMEQAFQQFASQISNADVVLFFYAGHGIQVNGANYLIPVDAALANETDVRWQTIRLNDLVDELERYPNKVNIVILDACRNNPYRSWSRSSGNRGFKAPSPSSGTIIAFATSEDATAADGNGTNGLFTQELVKQILIPQSIESVFKRTRVQVQKLSEGRQIPQEWSKLNVDFAFRQTDTENKTNTSRTETIIISQPPESDNTSSTQERVNEMEPVFTLVEEEPRFLGGEEGRIKWITSNIQYPEEAKQAGIQGTVFVSFVIEKDGSTSNPIIKRGIGGGCDEEVLRLIKSMPKWTPGKQKGSPVRVQFNLPIKFTLSNK